MCLNEAYSRVREGKHFSDVFPDRNGLKEGDALSPLLFNVALEYAFKRVSGKSGWLEIKWYTSTLVYADDVNVLGGSVHTTKENAEAMAVASKEIAPEANGRGA